MLRAPAAPSKWLTLIAASFGLAMLTIDTFVVNVAFPAIGRDLHASLATAEWTVTSYVLVTGVFPVAMGRVGDIFGRREVYLAGLALFILSSAGCGLSATIEQLVAFRVVQGIGAATMMPGTLSIITNAFPAHQRGLAIGIWGGVSGLGLIAGPILGGLLVHGNNWRWIFFVNVPVGFVGLVAALAFIPQSRDPQAPRSLDIGGLALLSASLFALLFAVSRGNEAGWSSPLVLACLIGGAALLPAFALFERRVRYPLVDLTLFKSMPFVTACVSASLFSAAVFGSQPYTSLFMQNYLGFSPLQGGLAFIPATALVAALLPISGILGQRLGSRMRWLIIGGSLSVALSFVVLLSIDTDSTYANGLLVPFILRGIGIGSVMSATSYAVMSSMPMARAGLASGTLTMARNIGTSVGVAIFGAFFLHTVDSRLPDQLAAQGIGPDQSGTLSGAAHHFVASGSGPVAQTTANAVIDGYLAIAVVGLVVVLAAAAAALFLRPRDAAARAPSTSLPESVTQGAVSLAIE